MSSTVSAAGQQLTSMPPQSESKASAVLGPNLQTHLQAGGRSAVTDSS